MTPEEKEMDAQRKKDEYRFVRESRPKRKHDKPSTSTVIPLPIALPSPGVMTTEKDKAPDIFVDLEGDATFADPPAAHPSSLGAMIAPDVIAAEVAAGTLSGSSQEASLLRKRKRPPSSTSSHAFHLLRTAINAEKLCAMMETLTKEELECELNYLHLWHGGVCDTLKSLYGRIRETNRAAQQDKDRSIKAEGRVWTLEEDLKKANDAVENQKAEITKLQKKLIKAEEDAVVMKTRHETECSTLAASLEQLKESSSKEKEELLSKLKQAEEERQKELQEIQDKHDTEMATEAAEIYEDLMEQVHILYPFISLEGVHYLHSVVDGKVMKPGDEPGSRVEVVLPEPMHTSPTTKLADATVQNESSDAHNMEVDPHAEVPPLDTPVGVQNMDTEQDGNKQGNPEVEPLP